MSDTRDLCTLSDVKALMQKVGPNAAAQDSLIASLITRASVKIMRDYGREFVPGGTESLASTSATRTFEYPRDDAYQYETFVDLNPYDITATTPTITVAVDTDQASSLTLLSSQFSPWPRPASNGVFSAIRISTLSNRGSYPPFSNRQIQITANWGFPTIPLEVTQATAETVIHWITSYPGARRVDQVDSGTPPMTPRSYPMAAVDLLAGFKRVVG